MELMMVIACLAILAAIAVPGWVSRGRPAYRLKNAAHQVVSDIRLARMRAIATNRQYRLCFAPMSDSYLLERGDLPIDSSTWVAEGVPRNFGSKGGSSFLGIHIAGEDPYLIVFRPTGAVTSTTVNLQNTLGRTIKIVCSMAGRIRVVKE